MGFLFIFVVGLTQVFGSPYFDPVRLDLTVPEKCRDLKLSYFKNPSEEIYVGRQGALAAGFTIEYPVTRNNARLLWRYFKSLTHQPEDLNLLRKIKADPVLRRDYDIILRNYEEQDFWFQNEGEILEVLAIHHLYKEFPENHYYITGGIEYHEMGSEKTIGEIDLLVGLRDSCESYVVGEVKLGRRKMLSKAKEQLRRFENFLINHSAPPFGGEYQPGPGIYAKTKN